jgi:hypothetical protein
VEPCVEVLAPGFLDDPAGDQRHLEEAERLGADLDGGAFVVGVAQLLATASEPKRTSDPTGDVREVGSRIADLDGDPRPTVDGTPDFAGADFPQ